MSATRVRGAPSWPARLLFALALGLLLVFGLLAGLSNTGEELPEGTSQSFEAGGRRALLGLFEGLGYEARAFEQAPGALPRGHGLLWLPPVRHSFRLALAPAQAAPPDAEPAAAPDPAPVAAQPQAPSSEAGQAYFEARDPRQYLRFLEEGGTLLAGLAADEQGPLATHFLSAELGLEWVAALVLAPPAEAAGLWTLESGESLAIAPDYVSAFSNLEALGDAGLRWSVVATDEQARPVILAVQVGRGQLVLVPQDELFGNQGLAMADHALLAVRLAELFAPAGPLLFDDFAAGGARPPSMLELLLSRRGLLLLVTLLTLLALGVWSGFARGAFVRDPEPHLLLSPLERARGTAGLWSRLGLERLAWAALVAGRERALSELWVPRGRSGSAAASQAWRALARERHPEALARFERCCLAQPAKRLEFKRAAAELDASVEALTRLAHPRRRPGSLLSRARRSARAPFPLEEFPR